MSDGMEESLLQLSVTSRSSFIVYTSDGIVSTVNPSNSNTYSVLRFFSILDDAKLALIN
jgi:hypothetical protein